MERSCAFLLALLLSGCSLLPLSCTAATAALYPNPLSVTIAGATAIGAYSRDFQMDRDAAIGSGIITCGYIAGLVLLKW